MKKFMAFVLSTVLVLAICASACADIIYITQNPMPAQAVRTVRLTDNAVWKTGKPGRLYVRHYLWSTVEGYYGSNNHTNYFQASVDNQDGSRLGGDWMAPNTANYVRSSSIYADPDGAYFYGLAGRANTKYADAGFPVVRISGYIDGQN